MIRNKCGPTDLKKTRGKVQDGGLNLKPESNDLKVIVYLYYLIRNHKANSFFNATLLWDFIKQVYPGAEISDNGTPIHLSNTWAALGLIDCTKGTRGGNGESQYKINTNFQNVSAFVHFFSDENLVCNGGVFNRIVGTYSGQTQLEWDEDDAVDNYFEEEYRRAKNCYFLPK